MAMFSKRAFQQEEDLDRRYYDEQEDEVVEDTEAPAGSNIGFGGVSLGGGGIELKVVRPEHFEDVSTIADHLLNGRTVVLNLENTNKETSRRLIDFLTGVAYSIDGSIKKVATNAYVITPSNVNVDDAHLKSTAAPRKKEEKPEEAVENEFVDFN